MSIPLLIGVIGHRDLPDEYRRDLEKELSRALDEIQAEMPHTPVKLVSSLAEGADRLGAHVGFAKKIELIVPLPFEPGRFEQDFPKSTDEFRDLLNRAQHSFLATESEYTGYEGASRWIARHCQIIIALWDGAQESSGPGGTTHTVGLRHHVGESGHILSCIADYLGPVLHLHCPRESCMDREKPRWIWPDETGSITPCLRRLLSPLDDFNAEADKADQKDLHASMKQLPDQLAAESSLKRAFGFADSLANKRQKRYQFALKASVMIAVIGYAIQQAWPTVTGRLLASLLLTMALFIIYISNRAKNLEYYLEYRAFAEVLRVACFWQLAGVTSTPTDRFLNQHWGSLRWIRSAVNALWIPDPSLSADLDLVKARWIDDQQEYYQKKSTTSEQATSYSRWVANSCFAASVVLAWAGVAHTGWGPLTALGSGMLLLVVGAMSHYSHTRGWEEDAARYRSMATPFSWAQKIWCIDDEKTRRILVQELGGECVAELSNWLLIHRNRPIGLIKG